MDTVIIMIALLANSTAHAKLDKIKDAIHKAAINEGVAEELLSAVCWVETRHKSQATNYDDGEQGVNSHGLCQIQYPTAQFVSYKGTVKDLYNPYINARYAARYLAYQLRRYNNDWKLAVAAYNAGSVMLDRRGQIVNYSYVEQVENALSDGR